MIARNVCTEPITHRRIVSSNPEALGASTSSRRIRREENHFIFAVGTKHHLCARNLQHSKMLTLASQVLDLTLINLIYSLPEKILKRSQSPAHSAQDKKIGVGSPSPMVKSLISGKSEWAVVTLINLIYSSTKGSNFPIKNHLITNHKLSWSAHETPVYRCLSNFIGFEIPPNFASPWGRGQGEGELFPCSIEPLVSIKNHLISNHKSSWNAHETLVYRCLSEIIGFEIPPNFDRGFGFASPWGRGQGEGELFPCSIEPLVSIKNHLISNHKSSWNADETPVYRCLSEIIGFEILLFHSVHSPVAVCKDPSVLIGPGTSSHKNRTNTFHGKTHPTHSIIEYYTEKTAKLRRTPPSPKAQTRISV
jgi:hypothetical protein